MKSNIAESLQIEFNDNNILSRLFGVSDSNIHLLEKMNNVLKYKPKGTKLSISNNSITYNSSKYYQGIIRSINYDKRDDLHNLYNPSVILFIKCFFKFNYKK